MQIAPPGRERYTQGLSKHGQPAQLAGWPAGRGSLLEQGVKLPGYVLPVHTLQPRPGPLQVGIGQVRKDGQAYPIPTIIGAHKRRIGIDQLYRVYNPGVKKAQRQPGNEGKKMNDPACAPHFTSAVRASEEGMLYGVHPTGG